jgi:hypothetical protein
MRNSIWSCSSADAIVGRQTASILAGTPRQSDKVLGMPHSQSPVGSLLPGFPAIVGGGATVSQRDKCWVAVVRENTIVRT